MAEAPEGEASRVDELTDTRIDGSVDWKALGRQFGAGIAAAVAVVALLAAWLQEPLQEISTLFVAEFGLLGVFVGVLFVDTFHLTHEPVLLAAYVGGVPFWTIVGVASVASILAGPLGWLIGRRLGRVPRVAAFLAEHRLDAFLRRYGLAAVAIAALTPIPYAATTWAAGAARVSFRDTVIGCTLRFPKVLFWLWVVSTSWDIGAR